MGIKKADDYSLPKESIISAAQLKYVKELVSSRTTKNTKASSSFDLFGGAHEEFLTEYGDKYRKILPDEQPPTKKKTFAGSESPHLAKQRSKHAAAEESKEEEPGVE